MFINPSNKAHKPLFSLVIKFEESNGFYFGQGFVL